MTIVYLSIGSNLGDRFSNCERAIRYLKRVNGVRVVQVSPWYESAPVYPANSGDPCFLNAVIEVETELEPQCLLKSLKATELLLGKSGGRKGEPRTVDLDILLFGNREINERDLTIPHPQMARRMFVLLPLCDIAPDAYHPVLRCSVSDLLQALVKGGNYETVYRYGRCK